MEYFYNILDKPNRLKGHAQMRRRKYYKKLLIKKKQNAKMASEHKGMI